MRPASKPTAPPSGDVLPFRPRSESRRRDRKATSRAVIVDPDMLILVDDAIVWPTPPTDER
jgi:hypothetical protein